MSLSRKWCLSGVVFLKYYCISLFNHNHKLVKFLCKIASIALLCRWLFLQFIYFGPNVHLNECRICSSLIRLLRNGEGYPAWVHCDLNWSALKHSWESNKRAFHFSITEISYAKCVAFVCIFCLRLENFTQCDIHSIMPICSSRKLLYPEKKRQNKKNEDLNYFVSEKKTDQYKSIIQPMFKSIPVLLL